MTTRTSMALPPPAVTPSPQGRDLGAALVRAAAQVAWTARNPREPLALAPKPAPVERLYYQAADGWEAPLFRMPPWPGAPGEPVVMAHDLGLGRLSLDYAEEVSLARTLREAGYDVYLLTHRGDREARHPDGSRPFDFDDIVAMDLPAALAAVRAATGARKVLWLGHSLGGLLGYAHAGVGGASDLAALVSLCAPVRFTVPRSQARVATLVSHLLPAAWTLPLRALHHATTPFGQGELLGRLGADIDGALHRGVQLRASEDLPAGVVRQAARWVSTGAFCDRNDQLDYVAALRGCRVPAYILAAAGDSLCPPAAAEPAAGAFADAQFVILGENYGHLDPLLGRAARGEVYPAILDFLEAHRAQVW